MRLGEDGGEIEAQVGDERRGQLSWRFEATIGIVGKIDLHHMDLRLNDPNFFDACGKILLSLPVQLSRVIIWTNDFNRNVGRANKSAHRNGHPSTQQHRNIGRPNCAVVQSKCSLMRNDDAEPFVVNNFGQSPTDSAGNDGMANSRSSQLNKLSFVEVIEAILFIGKSEEFFGGVEHLRLHSNEYSFPFESVASSYTISKEDHKLQNKNEVDANWVRVADRECGWTTLYFDPRDSSYWELTYPQSHLHGGGPPQLSRVEKSMARELYAEVVID